MGRGMALKSTNSTSRRISNQTWAFLAFLVIVCAVVYQPGADAFNEDLSKLRLELVQVTFRHGNRTPEFPYYNDPNANETFYPYGWDALDKAGRQSSYNLGRYLRNRYNHFVSDYDPQEVFVWSTGSSRTKMCAQLAAGGLFPAKNWKWDSAGSPGYIWQPIPYDYDNPLNTDYMVHTGRLPCPAYFEELDRNDHGPAMEELLNTDPELVQAYRDNIVPSDDIYLVVRLHTTLTVENNYNMTIPDWVKPFFPDRIRAFSAKLLRMAGSTKKLLRLRIGSFLKHNIEQMDLKKQGSNVKFWLYSGHDTSLVNLATILGVWGDQYYADFSNAIILELHSNPSGRYFVKTFFHNDTTKVPMLLTVPGCQELCPLNQFRNLFEDVIPVNLEEECLQVERPGVTWSYSWGG